MATIPTTCIFCGAKPLSREHIWAKWLGRYIPKVYGRTKHAVTLGQFNRSVQPGRFHGSSHGNSAKLKVVCHPCNNGWMSRLQMRAKPWLAALAVGNWSDLETDAQEALAAWVTMFTMVIEFADPPTSIISSYERREFMRTQSALPGWKIWIGRYDLGDRGVFNHLSALIAEGPLYSEAAHHPNTQTTGFSIGKTVFQVFSTRSRHVEEDVGFALRYGLQTIWPARRTIRPPTTLHTFATFMEMSNDFANRASGDAPLTAVPLDLSRPGRPAA